MSIVFVPVHQKPKLKAKCPDCQEFFPVEARNVFEEPLVEDKAEKFVDRATKKTYHPTHYRCPRCQLSLLYDPCNGDVMTVCDGVEIVEQ